MKNGLIPELQMASPTSQCADDISITSKKRDFLFFAYIFETLTDFGKLLDDGFKSISFLFP